MAELPSLELLQSLHRDLLSVAEHRSEDPGVILEDVASPISQLGDLLDQPNRTTASRDAVLSGRDLEPRRWRARTNGNMGRQNHGVW